MEDGHMPKHPDAETAAAAAGTAGTAGTACTCTATGRGSCLCLRAALCSRGALYRVGVLAACTALGLAFKRVDLIIALFGAVGQTGLVIVPCAVHLRLQWTGLAPRGALWAAADCTVIGVCAFVMVFGTVSAVRDVIKEYH